LLNAAVCTNIITKTHGKCVYNSCNPEVLEVIHEISTLTSKKFAGIHVTKTVNP
jgi:hypothetical protein